MKKICPICLEVYENEDIEYCPKHSYDHLDKFTKNMLKLLTLEEYDSIMNKSQSEHDVISASSNLPKCPTCGSTNIRHISSTERGINAVMFGFFGNKRKCQFECLNPNCRYRW